MPDKDVDEQFAAMMAHWDEEALGSDPFGDPDRHVDDPKDGTESAIGLSDALDFGGLDLQGIDAFADLDELDKSLDPRGDGPDHLGDDGRRTTSAVTPPTVTPPTVTPPTVTPPTITPPPPAARHPDLPPHQVPDFSGFVIDLGRSLGGPEPVPQDDVEGAGTGVADPAPARGSGWRQHDVQDLEEHFVPPPPAPLPSAEDKHFWLMVVGLVGGPLFFLYLMLFDRDGHGWLMVFALGMTIAGFVLLVLRQPFERDEDDHGIRL